MPGRAAERGGGELSFNEYSFSFEEDVKVLEIDGSECTQRY